MMFNEENYNNLPCGKYILVAKGHYHRVNIEIIEPKITFRKVESRNFLGINLKYEIYAESELNPTEEIIDYVI